MAVFFVGGEKVICQIDLVKAKGRQIFHFIHNAPGIFVAYFCAHHFPAYTEYAMERAATTGGHADGHAQGAISSQGRQVAGRHRQGIHIDKGSDTGGDRL